MESALHWVTQYGYAAIFTLLVLGIVGLPIPDETLLAFSGYLISQGRFRAVPTFATAFAGSVCGMSVSYLLGRTFGLYLVRRYGRYVHLDEERLDRVHLWFQRAGRWALTFGYYLPGIRHLTAYVAGASKLELGAFALFAYSGGFLWCTAYISLGYFLGAEWTQLEAKLGHLREVALAIVVLAVAAYLLWRQKHQRRPR